MPVNRFRWLRSKRQQVRDLRLVYVKDFGQKFFTGGK